MATTVDCTAIIAGISSNTESTRKVAAYHLQSAVSDASFADRFVSAGGMPVLKNVVLEEHGNALAYALGSFVKLLEAGMGWDVVNPDIIERAIQLVISRPHINVLRNALSLLMLVVTRRPDQTRYIRPASSSSERSFGISDVMPLLQMHEEFLECLIEHLGSADHALCVNALSLINALMRVSIVSGTGDAWPQFVIRLQELGVLSAVEDLMRVPAPQDLSRCLLDFQNLIKVLLARCRRVALELEKYEHRSALNELHNASFRPDYPLSTSSNGSDSDRPSDKWRRLGFQSEKPASDFEDAGFLGLMDLSDYVRRNTDAFRNTLLEQSILPPDQRCPVARASLSVTMLLYEYFDVEKAVDDDAISGLPTSIGEDNLEQQIEPLLLHWERLHRASLLAFFRLWKEAGAVDKDYHKVEDLARLLIGTVLGRLDRKSPAEEVERKLVNASLSDVRKWQLSELDEAYDYAWGADLVQLRSHIHQESLQFLKEQRIRCLLQGSWFPVISSASDPAMSIHPIPQTARTTVTAWRFVRLSYDRGFLHHATFPQKLDRALSILELPQRLDLNTISSVDSSVSRVSIPTDYETSNPEELTNGRSASHVSTTAPSNTVTSLTIYGTSSSALLAVGQEEVLMELNSGSASLASEWLDGLLMLLNQQPITADTNRLIETLNDWSLKVHMLNLRWEDVDWNQARTGKSLDLPPRPTDREYWYEMGV
ncbi:hypothetical protein AAFC00_002910 [Neodothiora populina]|uniref:ELMO domain-containing protein n=1 Tax=Neodothiora populina TaxID=2781224 RepID=A0ABR3P919_9PEZI